jgi:nitronate monooxygenase
MSAELRFLQRLNLQHPIIQAPMAGGGDTPELVAAVCNAGALGFIGATYSSPQQIVELAHTVRAKTQRPFGINLFAPLAPPTADNVDAALDRLSPFFAELGLPVPTRPAVPANSFADQLAAVLTTDASVFSFTFGVLPADATEAIKQRNMFLMGTATTVEEAVALEKTGVDAIVTQGSEAGGHRGTFAASFSSGMVGTISLVPQVVDAVGIPVIASGGIMDGRGIAAALALGASAVQLGTAFLTCNESGISAAYKEAILSAHEDQTRLTRAFSGRPARGIINRFMTELEPAGYSDDSDAILPFPLPNVLTRPLRTAAGKQGRAEFLSLWAGQGVRMARQQSAAELIARLVQETAIAIEGLRAVPPATGTRSSSSVA